jgi:hypothetical protein
LKISKIILCGNNGNNGIFLEYDLPSNFHGEISFNFGQGGFGGACKINRNQLFPAENAFNEKIFLDISRKDSILVGNNTF